MQEGRLSDEGVTRGRRGTLGTRVMKRREDLSACWGGGVTEGQGGVFREVGVMKGVDMVLGE